MLDASVVLCVRNGASTLPGQLAALANQRCPRPWELVVVDNGSTDDTVDVVESWRQRLPVLTVVTANERAGLGYARNIGAAVAQSQLLAFCDADDVADPGWLAALLEGAGSAQLVGGRLELELLNGEVARYWRGMSEDDLRRPRALGYLPYAVGANQAVRREAFEAVGGYDETFSSCCDDIDFSWRLQREGAALTFRCDAVMHYRLRGDLGGLARQRYRYGQAEALLRRKFGDAVAPLSWRERCPTYRYLITRCWHLLSDDRRRGGWVSSASYCAGRISGAARYRVVHY